MAHKLYKLLVIDIDGTLINKEGVLSEKDTEAIKKAIQTGIRVVISTGRVAQASDWVLKALSLDGYHIFSDGALVANPDSGEEVYVEPVKPELVRQLIELSYNTKMHFDFYSSKHYFIEQEDWAADIRRNFFRLTPTIVNFNDIWQTERIIKGTIIVRNDEERATARDLEKKFAGKLSFSWTDTPRYPGIYFINILSNSVSKGKALSNLCAFLKVSPALVMAIGDSNNDISLFKKVGLAVAMGNATPELKKIAHHITLSVDDGGVAAAIEEYLI
jgi:hypothetical protein